MDEGQTQIVTFARHADFALEERVHCLEMIEGFDFGRLFLLGPQGASIGRSPPADIVLADSEVSRSHCSLALENGVMTVTDLNSTNGTFVDGARVVEPTPVPVGAILRVGRQSLKHEWRTQKEILQHDVFERELQKAHSYVLALLPPPIADGPIRADWLYEPCSKLGGDAFGYGALNDTQYLIYMVDVSGHGAGAAMHSVALMNLLRQRAVPRADMAKPEEVLAALNSMFPMEDHAGMYFTMWYGVYDRVSRELQFASAGHHPAFLVQPARETYVALRTRNGLIGADPGTTYRADKMIVPKGASLYLFSDGVFEIVTKDGIEWGLSDFLPFLLQPAAPGLSESQRLYKEVRRLAQSGGLEDDFSLLILNFE
ncbi:MAG TPA: SpoIIE family protein phosphatase [Rhizomicrobium sp.]|nr:SpoIIE family protein phosphatase [Rhizomicrobium sp.]